MYEYSYLYGIVAFVPIWLYCFIVRPDLRPAMLTLSFLFGIGGVLSNFFVYGHDWWEPQFVTGTTIGAEDFLFGFFFSGSVAVFYEIVFNKTYKERDQAPRFPTRFRYIALTVCSLFFGSALIFNFHSFSATVLTFGISTLYLLSQRRDLIPNSIFGALFAAFLAFLFFGIPELLTAGWVASTWSFQNLSGTFILHVPMEDFVWFVMAGAFIAPLYKFWKNFRSIKFVAQENTKTVYNASNKLVTESDSD